MNSSYGQYGAPWNPAKKVISAIQREKAAGTYTNITDLVAKRDAAATGLGQGSGMDPRIKWALFAVAGLSVVGIGYLLLSTPKPKTGVPHGSIQ